MEPALPFDTPDQTVIGVVSDTHGLLRPEALKHLNGVHRIVHAGDIGAPNVLERLQNLAPVDAVRGNNDKGTWAEAIPETLFLEIRGHQVHVLHDLNRIDLSPSAVGLSVVISGHSHKPVVEEHDGVLFINPGSLGPRRFRLPISLAKLYITAESVRAEIIELRLPG
jgi:putative phosphoesterase